MRTIKLSLLSLLFLAACTTTKKATNTASTTTAVATETGKEKEFKEPKRERYNPAATRDVDILHTKLEVSFDWDKSRLNGKATIEAKPYFYPMNDLKLDARNFDIHKVGQIINGQLVERAYDYDTSVITIKLDKTYTRDENFTVYVEYTAKPEERVSGGSSAITSDKGLYFINPQGEDPDKHIEIWTQGETEANSFWFPTVDKPNEKMTHEILITVREDFETLSNGLLISSKPAGNGMRTDHWKMSLPHAPYLVMMAVGDYAIVKDYWKRSNGKEMEVSYYVEKEYEPYARDIFGATPEMIDFFSKRLGVEYPWEKYAQVVVRDYVSGAMENTTATIHGEFLYRTKRELLDGHNESIIAHELFHHWFGDLVTCESWANLPVNESFANYSQFLWDEYKHGDDEADHYAFVEMSGYILSVKQSGHADMIRFNYGDKEEMFDAHSYNKGGRILHMLRGIIGDEAFFESLRVYLTENSFTAAEMHQLRMACEKVTGQDLNWFFDQWFYAKGHPDLKITQEYNEATGKVAVMVEQKQNFDEMPLYILPVDIDVYTAEGKQSKSVRVENRIDTFYFDVKSKPLLVNFDARKTLLCEKKDVKPIEQWIYQYYNAPRYMDRREAIEECGKSSNEKAQQVVLDALSDKSRHLKEIAIRQLKKVIKSREADVKSKLMDLAQNDKDAGVRTSALYYLSKYFSDDTSLAPVYESAINGESYEAMGAGLKGIATLDTKKAMELAKRFEGEKNGHVRDAIADIYAKHGGPAEHEFFITQMKKVTGFEKFGFLSTYNEYLKRQDDKEVEKGLPLLADVAENGSPWWLKLSGYQMLSSLQGHYSKKEQELSVKMESLTKEGKNQEAAEVEKEMMSAKVMGEKVTKVINDLKAKETDENVLKYIGK